MLDSSPAAEVDNTGNRDNTIITTCRVCGHGFRPGVVYVNPDAQNEVSLVDENGKISDSWYLDYSLDVLPYDEYSEQPDINRPNILATQEAVGDQVLQYIYTH